MSLQDCGVAIRRGEVEYFAAHAGCRLGGYRCGIKKVRKSKKKRS